MKESIMQYDMPNLLVAHGMASTETRLQEMQKSLDDQRQALKDKERTLKSERRKLVLADYLEAVRTAECLVVGDTFYYNGYSVVYERMLGECDDDRDYCDDPEWLAIPEQGRPGKHHNRDSRGLYRFRSYAKIGSVTWALASDYMWRDNGKFYAHTNEKRDNHPVRCIYPEGSHYPLRGAMSSALQGAKIKLAENDRDYDIEFRYAAPEEGRSKAYLPVLRLRIVMKEHLCSDLRMVANHQNQYNKLLAVFKKRGWLDSHSYEIEQYPAFKGGDEIHGAHPKAGLVRRRVITFNFKMVTPKETEI
jgi:hypothetical protein